MQDFSQPRRHSLFAKSLKSCVAPLMRPVFKMQGLAASKLISEWEAIIGKELAAHTMPAKLTFAKDKNSDGTLTIACTGAQALTLQHMQPIIIERIACYFGYKAVARIAIEQRPMTAAPTKRIKAKNPIIVDTSAIAGIEDTELREALSGLAKTFSAPTVES